MTRIEAARILHPDTTRAALAPYAYDPSRKIKVVEEACRVAASCLTDPAYNDERRASVAKTLRGLKVNTGSLACLGCGHEQNCSTKGCNIIRAAIDLLDVSKDAPEDVSKLDT